MTDAATPRYNTCWVFHNQAVILAKPNVEIMAPIFIKYYNNTLTAGQSCASWAITVQKKGFVILLGGDSISARVLRRPAPAG